MANEIYHRSNWGNAVNDNAWGDVYQKFDATNEMFIRSDNYENSNETDKLMAAINPKPSILLTPTAYDNGSLHSVKPVKTFSSEIVTNGDFTSDSDWVVGAGWTIENGKANIDTSAGTGNFNQVSKLTIGKKYRLSLSAAMSAGRVKFQSDAAGVFIFSSDVTSHEFIASSTSISFRRFDSTTNGYIDNVSIKEITEADFDFTRGTTATRVNEQGLVADVTDTNLPRIDYTGGTGQILLEPQTTNLLTYSEDFTEWAKNSGTTLTENNIISPDGTQNATLVVSAGSGSRVGLDTSIVSGTTYTFSVYLKNNGGNTSINIGSHATTQLETVTINNDWNRYTTTFTASSTTTSSIRIISSGSSINLHSWGAQLEALSFPTSYIPTSGSTSTRNADAANNSGSSDLINSTEGVLYAEISALSNDGTSRRISLSDGSINNRVSLEIDETANKIKAFISSGGVSQILEHTAADLTQNNKIAIKYKVNDMSIWLNGSEVVTDSSGNMPVSLDRLNFDGGNLSNDFYGKTKCVAVYKEALTDAQLTALTT